MLLTSEKSTETRQGHVDSLETHPFALRVMVWYKYKQSTLTDQKCIYIIADVLASVGSCAMNIIKSISGP